MPEEYEAETQDLQDESAPETVEAEQETQPETKTTPNHIPYDRFKEVYDDFKGQRDLVAQLQHQNMQMQQQLWYTQQQQQQRQAQQPPVKIDPEIDELIDPSLNRRLSPLEHRLAKNEQMNAAMWAKQEADSAWEYVKSEVRDFDELAPDIETYLKSLHPSRVQKITSDPDRVIEVAELVRAKKAAGQSISLSGAKQDLKQRTKSDAGTASPALSNQKIDWSDPNLDYHAAEEAIERKRRAGR